MNFFWGRALIELGGLTSYQILRNSEYEKMK